MAKVFKTTPSSKGSWTASEVRLQLASVGKPTGRAAKRIWWFTKEDKELVEGDDMRNFRNEWLSIFNPIVGKENHALPK